MKTSRVPSKTGSSAATEKAPRLGAKAQTQSPASTVNIQPPTAVQTTLDGEGGVGFPTVLAVPAEVPGITVFRFYHLERKF